jgi:ubiquinone/menaquinone biosynthesis C-methylase UbiE
MYSKDAVDMANSILEIGCGTGSYTKLIDNTKTIGIDLDVYALQIAKRYCPYTQFIAASATNLPLKDEILDLVCIWGVFEEIPVGAEIELINETKRVLKRGATFLFSASTNSIICKCLNPAFILGRVRHYDTNLLFDLLTKLGFVLDGYTLRGGSYTIISNFMVYFYKHILHRKSGMTKKFFEKKATLKLVRKTMV